MFETVVSVLLLAAAAGGQPLPEAPEPPEPPAREELVEEMEFAEETVLEAEDPLAGLEKEYRKARNGIRREEHEVYLQQLAPLLEEYTYEEDFSACYRHVPDVREQIDLVRQEALQLPSLRQRYNQARDVLRKRRAAYAQEKRRYEDEMRRWRVLRGQGYPKPSDLELRRRERLVREALAEVQRIEGAIQSILGKMEQWNRRERMYRSQEKAQMDRLATDRDRRIQSRIAELAHIPRYRFVAIYLDIEDQIAEKERRIEEKEKTIALLKEQGYEERTERLRGQIEGFRQEIEELHREAGQMRQEYLARQQESAASEAEGQEPAPAQQ